MTELFTLSAAEIGRRVNQRILRPREVVEYFLERISQQNPTLNAFTYVKEQEALEAAQVVESRLSKGEDLPFAGVPFALKDFLPSKKGWTNTHGGVKCLEAQDAYDSEFCKAMEKLGGIAIGKTNAPAFGFRGTTDNKLYGPTCNPYDYSRNAGGSSGGSAAAVAAGLVPIAEGGDAGGSIRIPAAWCGVYGFKASYGVIPNVCRPDAWAASHPFCTPGGLTKTVEDAEILLKAMAKYDPRDPLSRSLPAQVVGSGKTLRVAVTFDFGIFSNVDPKIQLTVSNVAQKLCELGHTVEYIPGIDLKWSLKDLVEIWSRHIMVDSAMEALYGETGKLLREHPEDVPSEVLKYLNDSAKLTTEHFYEFSLVRTALFDYFERIFSQYDIILSPVTTCLPVKNSVDKGETRGPGNDLIGFAETFLYNFTGHPAASCPVDHTFDWLPVGVQVAGRRFEDSTVLYISKILEQFTC